MKSAEDTVTIKAEPLAVTIEEAARMVGISRAQFYRLYLDTGRLRTVPKGRRRRMVDVGELRRAYELLVAESRAEGRV